MSTLFTGAAIMVVAASISTVGFLVVSKYVPERWLVADSDAASALYATIGMVYAILIAIAAIAVWEPHDDALQSAQQEAGDLSEAYWSAGSLDPVDSAHIRVLIATYDQSVIRDEWPSLRRTHAADPATAGLFAELRTTVQDYRPVTDGEQSAAADVEARLEDAADARRARLAAADAGMPSLLWPALVLGGIVSIGFLYLFGLDRTFPNGLMMATVAAMTTLVLFVIYQVEFPFSRGLSVDPSAFVTVLATLAGPT
jgi:hypothetical protein